jgi:Uma2 family endonuclease
MAFASIRQQAPPPADTRGRYAFTVADYHQLVASGHFTRTDRIELINGELTIMPPIGPEHASYTRRITNILPLKLPSGVMLQMNEPITIAPHSEPQPDAAIVRARADGYRSAHPTPKDVLLIIEVADTSVAFDTQVKAKLYSKAGIPEFWVIDVPEGCLRVFTEASARGYKRLHVFDRSDTVKSTAVSGLGIKVKELMP